MAVKSISFGSPHVRCTPMRRTCGEHDELMKTIPFGIPFGVHFTAPFFRYDELDLELDTNEETVQVSD